MRWAALGAAAAGAFGAVWLLRRRRLADEARARRSFAEPRAPRELVLAEKPARSWSCALLEVDVAHTPPLRATCLLAAALESASRELVVLVVADWRSWDGRGLSDYLIQWYTLLDALQSRGHRVDASVVLATPAEREATLTRLLLYPDLEVAFNCAAAPVTRANARRAELFLPRDLVASPLAETPSELAEELSARFPREPPAVLEGTRDRVRSAIIGGTFDHLHAGHKLLISVAAYLAEQKLGIGLSVQELLQNKKAKAMLQSFTERESALRRFVALIRAELDVFVAPLRDVSGPAGTLRELELLVVSQETVAGARVVNEQRARNGLPPLAVVVVGLAAEFGASEKTSSTYIRQALARELEARVEALRQRWGGLCARLSDGAASAEAADAWWARLRDAYSEPIRAYHTLTHVEAMLAALDEVEAHMERPDAARLAAWLHDAVYDPRGSDNEERSADWLDACCGALGVHGEDARLARELVLATKTHSVPDSLAARADARYFLDADLLVLALRPSIYDRYSRQIRAEYAHLSEAEFRAGRGRVLRSLLDRAALFLTPYFRDRHEERARLNLRRELASLGA